MIDLLSQIMNREFVINIVILLSLNLLIKPIYTFGVDLGVQNEVGEAAYGIYASLFDFTFIFYIFNDIGLQQYNNRTIAQHPSLIFNYLPKILFLKSLLALFYIFITYLVAFFIYPKEYFPIIGYVCLNHILISLVFYLRGNISGLGYYRIDSLLSAFDKFLMILLCGTLLWSTSYRTEFKIEWFIWTQTIATGLVALLSLLILKSKLPKLRLLIPSIDWKRLSTFWKIILQQSYPYAVVVILMIFSTRIDKVMIERLLVNGQVEAGIYAAGYRLLDAGNAIGFMFAGLLLPMFSVQLKAKQNVQKLLDLSVQMLMAGVITIGMSCWVFKEDIMRALLDHADAYYGQIMGYLMLSYLAINGGYIYTTLVTATGNLKRLNWLFISGILINVSLNLWLIPEEKALGAAKTTLLTQIFIMVGIMFLAKKELNIRIQPKFILKILAFGLVFTTTIAILAQCNLGIAFFPKFLISIAIGILFSFLFRLINIGILWNLFANRTQNSTE